MKRDELSKIKLNIWRRTTLLIGIAAIAALGIFVKEAYSILATDIQAWKTDQSGDCAVVLTGGPGRVREGLDLLAQGAVKKLIISGTHPQARLREIFPMWPYYGELREEDVVLERRSRTTYGNAQQTLPLVEAFSCKEVILITSRVHMRRALQTFRAVFPLDIHLIPRATVPGRMNPSFQELGLETVKSLFYTLWAY